MEQPTKFGRYVVKGVIGKGAMGVIYLAEDPIIGRLVAIKVIQLNPGLSTAEIEGLQTRFEREFRSAGTLSHPNIVTVHDVGTESSMPFIAMEYVEGKTLEHVINEQRVLSFDEIADLISQICDGLDFAHDHGVVHRDIKPANILLDRADRPKITDFGVAKLTESGMTHTGSMVGTPWYMSPEQVVGEPVTGAADQFSLAVMTYQLLTRERPFSGERSSTVLYKIVHEEPVRPHLLNPRLMDRIDDVLMRAFQKNPVDRYPTCSELAEDLREALGVAAARSTNRTLSGAPAPPTEWPTAKMTVDAGVLKEWQAATAAQAATPPPAQSGARTGRKRDLGRSGARTEAQPKPAPPPRAEAAAAESAAAKPAAPAAAKGPVPPRKGLSTTHWLAIGGVAVALLIGIVAFALLGGGGTDSADVASIEGLPDAALGTGAPVESMAMVPQPLPPELDDENVDVVDADASFEAAAAQLAIYRIVTKPPGATILVDGKPFDQVTPADVELPSDDRHSILIELEGHKPVSWTFDADRLSPDQQRTRKLYFPLTAIVAPAPSLDRPAPRVASTAGQAPAQPRIAPPTSPPGQLDLGQSTVRGGKEVPMPKKVQDAGPTYARESVPADRQPIVILELTLDPEGAVGNAKVLRGLTTELDEVARRTSYLWRYAVVPYKGKPVNTIITSTVIFEAP